MGKPLPSSIDATLTSTERAAPFALSSVDPDPLPPCTRTATVWEGSAFTEYDPRTGDVVALGAVDRDGAP